MRPARIANSTGASANNAISTPTAHSLRPPRNASNGADMRSPAIALCRPSWPTTSASSNRPDTTWAAAAGGSEARGVSFGPLVALEQVAHTRVGQRFDALELARHHACSALGLADRVLRFLELLARLGEHLA